MANDRILAAFDAEQRYCIERGGELTADLRKCVETALGLLRPDYVSKHHYYIYSPPGAGKTYMVRTIAARHGVPLLKFHGSTSMFAFVGTIASAAAEYAGRPLAVWIDDCDGLFMEAESLNLMKGCMDADVNVCSYSKSMFSFLAQLERSGDPQQEAMAAALKQFQPPGGMGVAVPTNNMSFIVTSNMQLTAPSSALARANKKKMHEAAIRDRVNYTAYELTGKEAWGWVASQVLNIEPSSAPATEKHALLDLTAAQKDTLLLWMWDNWERLSSTSMRAVNDLAAHMLNKPHGYQPSWKQMLSRSETR